MDREARAERAVNCPACRSENRPGRRYCGKCGCNFEPACGGCGFANESDDRFCGGCGVGLVVASSVARSTVAAPPQLGRTPTPQVVQPAAAAMVDELAGLFAPKPAKEAESQLPEVGIEQHDLDRLFGVVP